MELRGFDSYDITLGDEMRGERASLGKSLNRTPKPICVSKAKVIDRDRELRSQRLPEPERHCRIRPVVCTLSRDGRRGLLSTFLSMSPVTSRPLPCNRQPARFRAAMGLTAGAVISGVGSEIAKSRFAAPPVSNRFRARISLGALTSSAALIALVAGSFLWRVRPASGHSTGRDRTDSIRADCRCGSTRHRRFPQSTCRHFQKPQAGDYRGGGALGGGCRTDGSATTGAACDGTGQSRPSTLKLPACSPASRNLRPPAIETIDTPDDSIMLATNAVRCNRQRIQADAAR